MEKILMLLANARTMLMMAQATNDKKYLKLAKKDIEYAKFLRSHS